MACITVPLDRALPWPSSGWDSALPTRGAQLRSLVRELRSHMPCGTAKKTKQNKQKQTTKQKFKKSTTIPLDSTNREQNFHNEKLFKRHLLFYLVAELSFSWIAEVDSRWAKQHSLTSFPQFLPLPASNLRPGGLWSQGLPIRTTVRLR